MIAYACSRVSIVSVKETSVAVVDSLKVLDLKWPIREGEQSSSTKPWKDVPRGTMDEVSSYVRLDLPSL
jgi:hypothetical protein